MRKTALFVAASTLFSTPFIFAPVYAGLKWQKLSLPFPDMPILQKDGTELRLKQFFGKPVLINFWATWCAPCREEMPSLDDLQSNSNFDNLKIFPINIGQENFSKSDSFFRELNIQNLEIYFDAPITLAKKFSLRGSSYNYFI